MPYEEGMQVMYDEVTHTLTVRFRGIEQIIQMQAKPSEAIKAGEDVCRALGWNPNK